jgi:hypothetical protein
MIGPLDHLTGPVDQVDQGGSAAEHDHGQAGRDRRDQPRRLAHRSGLAGQAGARDHTDEQVGRSGVFAGVFVRSWSAA